MKMSKIMDGNTEMKLPSLKIAKIMDGSSVKRSSPKVIAQNFRG